MDFEITVTSASTPDSQPAVADVGVLSRLRSPRPEMFH